MRIRGWDMWYGRDLWGCRGFGEAGSEAGNLYVCMPVLRTLNAFYSLNPEPLVTFQVNVPTGTLFRVRISKVRSRPPSPLSQKKLNSEIRASRA